MEPGANKEKPEIAFNIQNRAGVVDDVVEAVKEAIRLVWKRKMNSSCVLELEFVDFIIGDNGKIMKSAGRFDPETGGIAIAVSAKTFKSFNTSQKDTSILVAAHEMAHKAQWENGVKLIPSENFDKTEYINDPNELEAWDEALHVFKKIYPKSKGGFELNGRRFEIPTRSEY